MRGVEISNNSEPKAMASNPTRPTCLWLDIKILKKAAQCCFEKRVHQWICLLPDSIIGTELVKCLTPWHESFNKNNIKVNILIMYFHLQLSRQLFIGKLTFIHENPLKFTTRHSKIQPEWLYCMQRLWLNSRSTRQIICWSTANLSMVIIWHSKKWVTFVYIYIHIYYEWSPEFYILHKFSYSSFWNIWTKPIQWTWTMSKDQTSKGHWWMVSHWEMSTLSLGWVYKSKNRN